MTKLLFQNYMTTTVKPGESKQLMELVSGGMDLSGRELSWWHLPVHERYIMSHHGMPPSTQAVPGRPYHSLPSQYRLRKRPHAGGQEVQGGTQVPGTILYHKLTL